MFRAGLTFSLHQLMISGTVAAPAAQDSESRNDNILTSSFVASSCTCSQQPRQRDDNDYLNHQAAVAAKALQAVKMTSTAIVTHVPVIAAESPDDPGQNTMRTRSGTAKTHNDLVQAPDSEPAKLRRSSRHRKSARHTLDSSDDEEQAAKPSAQRQLTLPSLTQVCLGQEAS